MRGQFEGKKYSKTLFKLDRICTIKRYLNYNDYNYIEDNKSKHSSNPTEVLKSAKNFCK